MLLNRLNSALVSAFEISSAKLQKNHETNAFFPHFLSKHTIRDSTIRTTLSIEALSVKR